METDLKNEEIMPISDFKETLNSMPNTKEGILKIMTAIVELKKIKRSQKSNKHNLKWMNPFHAKFEDNSNMVQSNKDYYQNFIDMANLRIQEIKILNPLWSK